MQAVHIYLTIYCIVFLVMTLVSTALFLVFNDYHPIKGRGIGMLLLVNFFEVIRGIFLIMEFNVKLSCFARILMTRTVVSITVHLFTLRNLNMLWKFQQEECKLKLHKTWEDHGCTEASSTVHTTQSDFDRTLPFFLKYDATNPKFGAAMAVLGMTLWLLIVFYSATEHDVYCSSKGPGTQLWTSTIAIVTIITAACLWKMRNNRDTLYILREIQLCFVWMAIFITAMNVVSRTKPMVRGILGLTIDYGIVFILGILPFIRAYKFSHRHIDRNAESLKQQLTTPEGHKDFKEYLQREFSVENLLFFDDASKYELDYVQMSQKQRNKTSRHIFKKYVKRGVAPLEINIPSDVYERICQNLGVQCNFAKIQDRTIAKLQELEACETDSDNTNELDIDVYGGGVQVDLFKEASEHIFNLMERSSLPNFKIESGLWDHVQKMEKGGKSEGKHDVYHV